MKTMAEAVFLLQNEWIWFLLEVIASRTFAINRFEYFSFIPWNPYGKQTKTKTLKRKKARHTISCGRISENNKKRKTELKTLKFIYHNKEIFWLYSIFFLFSCLFLEENRCKCVGRSFFFSFSFRWTNEMEHGHIQRTRSAADRERVGEWDSW